jgi:hypothetical protein
MSKKKQRPEVPSGGYAALPHAILDSAAYKGASHTAKSLLIETIRQHNGCNNGHLQLSTGWLRKRGWTSSDVVHRAKQDLVERRLLLKTRQGGLNIGPDRWALNWLPISNPIGLDIRQIDREWRFFKEPEKQKKRSVQRSNSDPSPGTEVSQAVPPDRTKPDALIADAIPLNGNDVSNHVPRSSSKNKRIVGKPGKSGRPRPASL